MKGFAHEPATREGATNIWLTPPHIIEALGPFDLDPCGCIDPPFITARDQITLPTDGLSIPWKGRVWMNPPYGMQTGEWLQKLAEHGDGIALVFARTETRSFQVIWDHADAILFLKGRLRFYRPDGSQSDHHTGAPSVLAAFGSGNVESLRKSGIEGRLVDRWSVTGHETGPDQKVQSRPKPVERLTTG